MTTRPLQILDLEPSSELVFKGPFSEVVTTKLTLKNPTNTHVGFKVKTTAPKQYCVRPNSGIIEPHENAFVSVMLQPMEDVSEKNWPKHKFMVQSLVVDNSTTADSLDAAIKSAPKSSLMDSKLRCTFVEGPPVKEAAPSVPLTPSADDATPSHEHVSPSKESPEVPTSPAGGASPLAPTESRSDQDAVEEPPMLQPTAGSTPAHVTTQGAVEKEQYAAENRLLKDRAKKLSDENAQLKVEADRLKQRFVQQNTAVSRGSVRGSGGVASVPKPNNGGSPLNIVAIILILLALLLGYLVGTYIH